MRDEIETSRQPADASRTHANLPDVIYEIVTKALGPDTVVDVSARKDVDSDGDRVMRITIILNDDPAPDTKHLVGFVRQFRSVMEGNDDFPIVSFVSKADAEKARVEAAA